MTFICLFVVLAALFITVFNSRTVNHLSSEKILPSLPNSAKNSETNFVDHPSAPQAKRDEDNFAQKKAASPVVPTFS